MGEGYLTGRDEEDEKKSKWELVRKKSGGDTLEPDEIDALKSKLYPYLKDKAARRQSATSGANYASNEAQFAEDQGRYNAGALLGAMSKWQSQAGTLGGKRSDVEIIEPMNKALNDSAQQRYKNELALREQEESALGTDLRVGQFIAGQDEKDKDRKWEREKFDAGTKDRDAQRQYLYDRLKAEKEAAAGKKKGAAYKESDMIGPDGSSYLLDPEQGYIPSGLPKGTKPYRQPPAAGAGPSFQVIPGQTGPNGGILTRDAKSGKVREEMLPPGTGSSKPLTGEEKNAAMYYANAEKALKVLEEMEAKGYRPTTMTAIKGRLTPRELEGKVFNANEQRYLQAARDYTAAKLRLESGASIPQSEIDQQAAIYMLQAGEDDNTTKEKQASRKQALLGLKFKAGRGAEQIEKVPGTDAPRGKSADEMTDEEVDAELKRRGLVK